MFPFVPCPLDSRQGREGVWREGGREGEHASAIVCVPVVITSLHFHAKLSGCAERGNQQVVHRCRPGGRAGERLLHVTVPKFMVSLAIGRNTYRMPRYGSM